MTRREVWTCLVQTQVSPSTLGLQEVESVDVDPTGVRAGCSYSGDIDLWVCVRTNVMHIADPKPTEIPPASCPPVLLQN